MFDIIVIGAGVIGSFIARELSKYKIDVLVLEKENDVGNVTSMANSAIVHSGYDPVPNTLKARFNVEGNKMFPKICEDLEVEFSQIESLTVAIYDEQMKTLDDLALRSKQNGVDVELLSKDEVKKLEPNITDEVKGALLAKNAGIVNPFTLVSHVMENAVDNGVKLSLGEEVINIKKNDNGFIVKTNKSEYESKLIIDAAGIHSDDVHKMVEDISYSIKPRKGEYYVLDHYKKGLVNHVIFPLPSEKGKGILITPTTSGNYLVGPSSEFVNDKDDVSTDKMTLLNVKEMATHLVPNIPFNQTIRIFSGNRPTPSTHDFIIEYSKKYQDFIVVSGIESPGLASSPAIAKYVVDELVKSRINLIKNDDFNPKTKHRIRLNELSSEERNKLIKKDPNYGQIICNCEKVSLGEIIDELSRSVPPHTIKALKKRTRSGFGKCQGGFCQPIVISILANYYNLKMDDIKYDKDDSIVCKYITKE